MESRENIPRTQQDNDLCYLCRKVHVPNLTYSNVDILHAHTGASFISSMNDIHLLINCFLGDFRKILTKFLQI